MLSLDENQHFYPTHQTFIENCDKHNVTFINLLIRKPSKSERIIKFNLQFLCHYNRNKLFEVFKTNFQYL